MRHNIKVVAAALVAVGVLAFLPAKRSAYHLNLTLSSSSFENGGMIPSEFTCDGPNISPALEWSLNPANAPIGSYVLIVDDPSARKVKGVEKTFVHWIAVFAPSITRIPEGDIQQSIPARKMGVLLNDYNETTYKGPCPPAKSDEHTYRFTLFAVKQKAKQMKNEIKSVIDADAFEKAMGNDIIAKARITGKYKRQ